MACLLALVGSPCKIHLKSWYVTESYLIQIPAECPTKGDSRDLPLTGHEESLKRVSRLASSWILGKEPTEISNCT
jgi:hypothetical protein